MCDSPWGIWNPIIEEVLIFFPEANPKIESAVPECVDVVSCDLKKTLLYSHTEYMVSQQCQWAACAGAQTQNPLKILSQIFNKIKQASDRSNDGKSGNQINFRRLIQNLFLYLSKRTRSPWGRSRGDHIRVYKTRIFVSKSVPFSSSSSKASRNSKWTGF